MLKELIKLANHLDRIGRTKEADYIDKMLNKIASGNDDDDIVGGPLFIYEEKEDKVGRPIVEKKQVLYSEPEAFDWEGVDFESGKPLMLGEYDIENMKTEHKNLLKVSGLIS